MSIRGILFLIGSSALLSSTIGLAQEPKEGPCKQIIEACAKAGFVKGEAKEGKGLWADCINPIMQGKPAPAKSVIALPSVDATLISRCKEKHPTFGTPKASK